MRSVPSLLKAQYWFHQLSYSLQMKCSIWCILEQLDKSVMGFEYSRFDSFQYLLGSSKYPVVQSDCLKTENKILIRNCKQLKMEVFQLIKETYLLKKKKSYVGFPWQIKAWPGNMQSTQLTLWPNCGLSWRIHWRLCRMSGKTMSEHFLRQSMYHITTFAR